MVSLHLIFDSAGGVEKIALKALKIGVHTHFHPISTVGFCTFSPENFGQAYWAVGKYNFCHICTFSRLQEQVIKNKRWSRHYSSYDKSKLV